MPLTTRTEQHAWGGYSVFDADPGVEEWNDVYYTPYVNGGRWGIFDRANRPVEAAIERWLPDLRPLRQDPTSPVDYADVVDILPDHSAYVYGGCFISHFGHFLIETLARLWPYAGGLPENTKIIMHGDGSPETWFKLPFVAEIFGAMGLTPAHLVHAGRPFRISRLRVPQTSLRTQASASTAFRRLTLAIGDRLLASGEPWAISDTPAYLSKTQLSVGVERLVNEQNVVDVLAENGLEIFYPEKLSVADKIRLLQSRPVFCGWAMSAHHLSLFTEKVGEFELLVKPLVNSNFFLIDRLCGNNAHYYSPDGLEELGPSTAGWLIDNVLANPQETAREILTKVDRSALSPKARPERAWPKSLSRRDERHYWGEAIIIPSTPSIDDHQQVYALPFLQDGKWGIFDADDQAIETAIDRAWPDGRPNRCIPVSDVHATHIHVQLPDNVEYVYAGVYHAHFGHFLLESLSRLWPLIDGLKHGQKLVFHGPESPKDWFKHEYVRAIFEILGVSPESIIHIDRPMKIARLVVPAQSFRVMAFAHPAFQALCQHVGEKLVGPSGAAKNDQAVFLAKSKMLAGITAYENEHLILEVLQQHGVKIVFPEELSMSEKVRLFLKRKTIAGWALSGQHVSIFAPPGAELTFLTGEAINANCILIDRLNSNRSNYWGCEMHETASNPNFLTTWMIDNPLAVARELLDRL